MAIEKKYKVARRVNLDFEVVVQARNEFEATFNAQSIELDSWEQSGASWEIVKVERITHLQTVTNPSSQDECKNIIQIWRRT